MNAKEMFEKLGYKLDTAEESAKLYCKDILDSKTFGYKDSEMVYFDDEYNNIYFTNKDCLTIEELQAINKQVEELHWNDITINIDVKLDGKKVMEAMKWQKQLKL